MTILERAAGRGVSTTSKGLAFAQVARVWAASRGDPQAAAAIAARDYGEKSLPALHFRAAVGAGTTSGTGWAAEVAGAAVAEREFVEALRPLTVLGRLQGVRHVPTNVKFPRATIGSTIGWVGEARPIVVSAIDLDMLTLAPFKIAGIVVSTSELMQLATPAADGLVRDDLFAGVSQMMDRALLDPTAVAAAGVSPASVTNGAQQIASAGTSAENAVDDIRRLLEALYGSNLIAPYLVTTPRIAIRMSQLRLASGGGYAFPGLGARGGQIFGIPVLTSASVPESDTSPQTGSIVALDAAELIVADSDEIALDLAKNATIQLESAPTYPPTSANVMRSLWAEGLVGWRVIKPANWVMRRAGCAAVLTSVQY